MAALLKLIVFGGAILTLIYAVLSIYSRQVRRGKLEAEWLIQGKPGSEEEFVEAGLKEYDSSLRRKLIFGVYVIPVTVVAVVIYLTNFN
ncbi:hypothetical protein [Roseovarius nanhaiticus]|uniref:Cation/multidrug efflux pump n=1 Tax=Roseovarius nanhaiticus TaxID=573024 RepID=A0A1N7GZE7_9RHOB|nr:hypothetical protein [Roseovarius nanhaiticus]SEL18796.1 hypothetical protein SAMN05216208_3047 [Roseovarius nanhaiticus]SIS17955.1 hypothetical protein SAMN05421666_2272 [Roseovarius nanhaiticus]